MMYGSGMDPGQARNLLAYITAKHLPADEKKAEELTSLQFAHLVEQVGHVRENALKYWEKETQTYLDSLRKSPLLTLGQRIWIFLSTFFKKGYERYHAIAEKVVGFTRDNYFKDLRNFSPKEIEGLFQRAAEEGDVEGMTRLLEAFDLDKEMVFDTYSRLSGKWHIAAFREAAENVGLEIPEKKASTVEHPPQGQVGGGALVLKHGKGVHLRSFLKSLLVIARSGTLAEIRELFAFAKAQYDLRSLQEVPLQIFQEILKREEEDRAALFREVMMGIAETCHPKSFELLLSAALPTEDLELIQAFFQSGLQVTDAPDVPLKISREQFTRVLLAAYTLGKKNPKLALSLLAALTEIPLKSSPKDTREAIAAALTELPFPNEQLIRFFVDRV